MIGNGQCMLNSYMEGYLTEETKLAKYFLLQVDECTDISDNIILLGYNKFEYNGDMKK